MAGNNKPIKSFLGFKKITQGKQVLNIYGVKDKLKKLLPDKKYIDENEARGFFGKHIVNRTVAQMNKALQKEGFDTQKRSKILARLLPPTGLTEEQKKAKELHMDYLRKIRRMESDEKSDMGEKLIENRRGGGARRVINRGSVALRREERRTSVGNASTHGIPSAIGGGGAHGITGGGEHAVGIKGLDGRNEKGEGPKGMETGDHRFALERTEKEKAEAATGGPETSGPKLPPPKD